MVSKTTFLFLKDLKMHWLSLLYLLQVVTYFGKTPIWLFLLEVNMCRNIFDFLWDRRGEVMLQ